MKVLFVLILVNLFTIDFVNAQNDYDDFYYEYKNEKGIVSFEISSFFLQFLIDDEDREFQRMNKKVKNVSFFIADSETDYLEKELNYNLPVKYYNDIMQIKDGGSTVTFKAKETSFGIKEILMIVSDRESLFVLCVSGDFDHEDAVSFSNSINRDKAFNFRQ